MSKTPSAGVPRVVVRSIALTPSALDALESLATTVARQTGRKSSASAVVRALLRHAQSDPDVAGRLVGIVEHEQAHELVWGKPPRAR